MSGEKCDCVRLAFCSDFLQAFGQQGFGLRPRQRSEFPSLIAIQRLADTIRVVQPLQGRLSAGAQRPLIDRVGGIAFDFDGSPFSGSHDQATAGRAFLTDRGVIGSYPRRDLLGLHHIGNKGFHRL